MAASGAQKAKTEHAKGETSDSDCDAEFLASYEKRMKDLEKLIRKREDLIEKAYMRYDKVTEKSDELWVQIGKRSEQLKDIYDQMHCVSQQWEETLERAIDDETLKRTMLNCVSHSTRRARKKFSAARKLSEFDEVQEALQSSFKQFQEGELKIDVTSTQLKNVARKQSRRRTEDKVCSKIKLAFYPSKCWLGKQ